MRFSLRSLVVFVAICAVAISVLFWATEEYRRQAFVRRQLVSVGATWVGFVSAGDTIQTNVLFTGAITGDLDDDAPLGTVEFKGCALDPESLQRLAVVERIDRVMFVTCEMEDRDIEPLTQFRGLSELIFWNVPVTDEVMTTIKAMSGLKQVSFIKTSSVTPQAIDALREARPDLNVQSHP